LKNDGEGGDLNTTKHNAHKFAQNILSRDEQITKQAHNKGEQHYFCVPWYDLHNK